MRRRRADFEEFWALDDVSFEIPQGTTFGLIGDNGSGKSTLLKTMAKILHPDRGRIRLDGRVAALLEVGSGFHPELSGRDNVRLNGAILGMSRAEIDRKFDAIVDFAGVEQFIDQPVKNYSSGMYVRLGFAIAINVDPEILLVDEVLAVGDAAFQDKCAEKFVDFKREGRTVVVVSHSLPSLQNMCDEVAWLSHGKLVESGTASPILDRYLESTRADAHVDADGASHWGSGEATIDAVELLTDGERVDRPLHTGDEVTVRVHYTARQRVERPVFGLAIWSKGGVHLWANNSRDTDRPVEAIEGRGVRDCTVPALALQNGSFRVDAAITDPTTTHVYDYLRSAAEFSVARRPAEEMGGFVALNGAWADPVPTAPSTTGASQA
ncbi:ABC transporter ATP-binding protein [Cellulomonas sp. zg-ZUI199]|uniref:ABC transporter ATP-binding protein n=2 Tax=Cellulomonas wangleii TaxID=2816956 RepID=A0ABX8DA06_9CELL|nr:ABC transporter ATP-binding protein [Cellulomonas wangleii]QVI64275.1 ABC transporter ATP-binding protein [Cellulomonas wangleii]